MNPVGGVGALGGLVGLKPQRNLELADGALGRLAVEEFRVCTGYESRPATVEREMMPAGLSTTPR